jgi:hypothetical protein
VDQRIGSGGAGDCGAGQRQEGGDGCRNAHGASCQIATACVYCGGRRRPPPP